GAPEQIAEIASVLIEERAAAEAAGVNLTSFDQALRERLTLFWPQLPLETQSLLLALFGVIIDDSAILPVSSPTPSTETATTPPTETTPPPPTETRTTTPETTTPTPETMTPTGTTPPRGATAPAR